MEIGKLINELKSKISELEAMIGSEESGEVKEEMPEGELDQSSSEDSLMKKKMLLKSMME